MTNGVQVWFSADDFIDILRLSMFLYIASVSYHIPSRMTLLLTIFYSK